jgi:DnaJ-class molecular chaperone
MHTLPIWDLIIGGDTIVETIYGTKINMVIPEQTQPDTQFRIRGHGIKHRHYQGDMIVVIKAIIPKVPSDLLEHIKEVKYAK